MALDGCDDYVRVVLTEAGAAGSRKGIKEIGAKTPLDIIKEFFEQQNGAVMSGEQEDICKGLLEEILKEGE
ncbi:MAG: hypothetical protein NC299_02745 [Lachnospiraceae bacterium]|nr:hypothetical protein [Ruminococcus sp.]MCM1274269.1 hypothetical protein [Lachnospiraceae bacterium]